MTTALFISPQLIEQFNRAASLARQGMFEESLVAWERLLNPTQAEKRERHISTGDFLGQAMMRKAWVMMDLRCHKQARAVLEDAVLQACLGQFDTETLCEYWFSYANVLGNLGDLQPMDDAFCRAMHIAADLLGDTSRMHQCWNNLMAWAEEANAWNYLSSEADGCLVYCRNVDDRVLHGIARLYKGMALARMGLAAEARALVQPVLAQAQEHMLDNLVARCRDIMRLCG